MKGVIEMGFFDELLSTTKNVASTAGKKTDEAVKISKLKVKKAQINSDIKAKYEKLGAMIYQMAKADEKDNEAFDAAVAEIGIPCVVKPVMSSSGHGQSTIKSAEDIDKAWKISQEGGRAGSGKVIVEGFVKFDYEITLLTVRHCAGTTFVKPVGHHQVDGDYRESWQPQQMSPAAIQKAEAIAKAITDALGGYGIFGVELFIKGEDVIFSEVSPRPHDTGMVTMISQDMSEFALHARAILGLPVPEIRFYGPSASKAIVVEGNTKEYEFCNLDKVLEEPGVQIRLFGKPEIAGHRRVGVILATADTVEEALAKAERAYAKLEVKVY